jgi:serine protease Do
MKTQLPLVIVFACLSCSFTHSQSQPAPKPCSVLQEFDQALEQVAERAMRSVVEIDVTGYGAPDHDDSNSQVLQLQRSLGSGVIVDPDGYIITNNHVVAGAMRIRVTLAPTTTEIVPYHTSLARKQRVYDAKLIGTNRYADLAVLKIEEKNLPYIALPDELYRVRLGQTVLAIGSPEGLDHTLTKGIVSAVGRQPDLDRPMVYIQTDAPINPGNSGGPLIDRDGNLIGINTFIYTSGGGSEGLGFAIPEPIVRFAYKEIKAHGIVRPVTIGAHAQTITSDLARGLKLPQDWGVIISDVDQGSPADTGGLRPGDIVLSVDGIAIDSLPKYTAFLYLHSAGHPMQIKVLRGGTETSASITPIDAPRSLDNLADLINPRTDLIAPLGIFVLDLNGTLAESFPTRSGKGVIVAGLLKGEPSTLADVQPGDVIRSINSKPVVDAADLRRQLAGFKTDDSVVLEVERQSVIQYVVFEME